MFFAVLFLILGLVVLIGGAEVMVRGGASIARKSGISPLVVGLTVVAFGTSAPELVVNIYSALNGSADIAVGNVIGSNIANILLILGVAGLITPLIVHRSTTWKEIPFALLASVLVFLMGNDALFDGTGYNAMTRTDGFALIAMFAIFMYYVFGMARQSGDEGEVKVYSYPLSFAFVFLGIAGLFWGGKLLVDNAVILARLAGLSESLIGLTIVALGTSLPELATSVVAVLRKQNDIAVGNVVGSNIFNVFWILGLTATLLQMPFNPATNVDVLVAVAATLALFFAMFLGKRHVLQRWQAAIFLLSYFAYIGYLIYRG